VTKRVAAELRGVRAMSGGPGVIILTRRNGALLSGKACRALERAATEYKYLAVNPWQAVAEAIGGGALGILLLRAEQNELSGTPPKDAPAAPPRPRKGARP
jgi:hypothetical protein